MLLKHEIENFAEFTGVHKISGSKGEVVGINKLSSLSPLADLKPFSCVFGSNWPRIRMALSPLDSGSANWFDIRWKRIPCARQTDSANNIVH